MTHTLKEIGLNRIGSSSSAYQRVFALSTLAALVLAACDKTPPAPPPPAPDAQTAAQPVPPAAPPAPVARAPAAPVRSAAVAPPTAVAPPPYEERAQPVYTEYRAPIAQPAPIAVPWAPPPMRIEEIPPQPAPDASWTGGYWVWREGWVWAPGHWATPPRPRYHWVPPYYEHRADRVVFVDGFWSPPGVGFVRPAAGVTIALAVIGAAVAIGHPPVGPEGIFVPPPPGSRPGLLVPAPLGTAPAVVVRAPAIIAPGMRVNASVNDSHDRVDNRVDNSVHNNVRNTTINNNRNTTVVNNITNVTIEAPASATANHQAVRVSVPSQPHLAAAMAAREAPPQMQPQAQQRPQPQPQPQPQEPPRAPQSAPLSPPRKAEPVRGADTQHADEAAMKHPLPVNRAATATPAATPPMHTERERVQEVPQRAPAEPRATESRPAHSPQATPSSRPETHRPAPPDKPAAPAARAEPAHPAAPAARDKPAAHPAEEKQRAAEPARKPNGEQHDENGRKEREPR